MSVRQMLRRADDLCAEAETGCRKVERDDTSILNVLRYHNKVGRAELTARRALAVSGH